MTDYDEIVIGDSPVAYWKLDEAAPPFADSVGSHDITTVVGSGTYQCRKQVGSFAGLYLKNDCLDTGRAFVAAPAVTYEFWFSTLFSSPVFAGCRNGPTPGFIASLDYDPLSVVSGGQASVGWNKDSVWVGRGDSVDVLNDAKVHHFVAVWTGGSVAVSSFKIYIDGVRVDNISSATGSDSSTTLTSANLQIGRYATNVSPSSEFSIARFATYESALGAEQVLAHFAAGNQLSGAW